MVFTPEVIIVGSDSKTGLLTRNFTLYYEVVNLTAQDGMLLTEGYLGNVNVMDPIYTDKVSICNFKAGTT